MMRHVNGELFSPFDVFTDDFRDDYFYLSEAIGEIVRVDSPHTRERYELFRPLSDRQYAQRGATLRANKVIHDIKTM